MATITLTLELTALEAVSLHDALVPLALGTHVGRGRVKLMAGDVPWDVSDRRVANSVSNAVANALDAAAAWPTADDYAAAPTRPAQAQR